MTLGGFPASGVARDASAPWGGIAHVAGMLVLGAVLVYAHPLYGFFIWVIFIRAFEALRGAARWVGVGGVAALISWSQTGAPTTWEAGVVVVGLALLLLNGGIAVAMLKFTEVSEQHEEQRRQTVAALERANRELEAALAEIAGLQEQLIAQAREAGVAAERERFAGEVHDTIAQGLAGVVTQLEASDAAGTDPDRLRHLVQAKDTARRGLAEARRSLRAVGPETLEHARLPIAIRDLVGTWGAESGVQARVAVTGSSRPLPTDADIALYRGVQEALVNVAKHAHASRTVVTLSYTDLEVLLDVRDDGRGPGLAGPRSAGSCAGSQCAGRCSAGARGTAPGRRRHRLRVRSMRQRVGASGGRMTVESEPGVGTTVSIAIPVNAGPGQT